jgi:hypothetical protein
MTLSLPSTDPDENPECTAPTTTVSIGPDVRNDALSVLQYLQRKYLQPVRMWRRRRK